MIKFYDTSALLELQNKVLEENKFLISNITLKELEQIKSSGTRDEEIKWSARKVLHILSENEEKYEVIIYNNKYDELIKQYSLPLSNDSQIIISALVTFENMNNKNEGVFVTEDLSCKKLGECIGLKTEYAISNLEDTYSGYITVSMDNEQLANFYNIELTTNQNTFNLLPNQYLLIEFNNKVTDEYKWTGERYEHINYCKAQSKMFGKVIPKNNDPYQQIALDSLISNKITLLRGRAGTGKTYLAFAYMFELLEKGEINKIVIFCNTVATKGSARLGFYPGSRTEKLLDSQIGNLLESKLGDRIAVERLVDEGQLVLLPMSDIRGYDTTGMNAAIYISEAQNLDIELMRLALQRIGEDSICIIDGDYKHQVDMSSYAGVHNGMRRVSEVFRGQKFYGEIELKNIYRSDIARIAELM